MSLKDVKNCKNLPDEFNVIIEIPMNSNPVKYEVDKTSGALFVDRFMSTSMFYPANYGYVPESLSEDGDPVDVLVITPVPVISGAVIKCRAIGMLNMTDEAGPDAKVLALPVNKLCKLYEKIESFTDLPQSLIASIEHFFTHYKDLEEGKWVKTNGWEGPLAANKEILSSVERFQQKN